MVFSGRNSCAQVCQGFFDPLVPAQLTGLVICNDSVETGESMTLISKEFFQLVLQSGSCGIGMNADGPEPEFFSDRLPKLLRNPKDVVAHERAAGEAIGQNPETLADKGTERAAIKSVAGSNEQARTQAVSAKDCEPGANPLPLIRFFDAREFSFPMQSEEGLAMTGAKVAVAMHGNRGSGSFQRSHPTPKVGIGIL